MRNVLLITTIDKNSYESFGYKDGFLKYYLKPKNPLFTSLKASKRLREDAPLNYLVENFNYNVDVFSPLAGSNTSLLENRVYTHILIAKVAASGDELDYFYSKIVPILKYFKAKGTKILVDYTNDLLVTDPRYYLYQNLLEFAELIIIPSLYMYETKYITNALKRGTKVFFIDDPLEIDTTIKPKYKNKRNKLFIASFGGGHSYSAFDASLNNLINLFDQIPNDVSFKLIFEEKFLFELKKRIPSVLTEKFDLIPWRNQPQLINILSGCHIAFLPSQNKYASTNRLTLSISLGLVPICSPVPSYTNFSKVTIISTNPAKEIPFVYRNYEELSFSLEQSQIEILEEYKQSSIGIKWHELFGY